MEMRVKDIGRFLLNRLRGFVMPLPAIARHAEYSALFSEDDAVSRPSERLLDIALEAARLARGVSLDDVADRVKSGTRYAGVWPGEHYRLLASLVQALKPAIVVEIGTATGLSALAMKKYLPSGSRIETFDIAAWRSFPGTCLREEDFLDGSLSQRVSDLSDPETAAAHRELLGSADLIFADGPKDGVMERRLLQNFNKVGLKNGAILLFDDIRLWNMLRIWREISMPKLDLTSFGHWSGTGLVEWRSP